MLVRSALIILAFIAISFICGANGISPGHNAPSRWASAHLNIIKETFGFLSPPGVARALAIVDTAMFDAMAAYTRESSPVYSNIPRRPVSEHTLENRNVAVSYAAYRTINWLYADYPDALQHAETLFTSMKYDKKDIDTGSETPEEIGNAAASAVISARAHDGMNQLADRPGTRIGAGNYSDYTGYTPSNPPQEHIGLTTCSKLNNINQWQPLRVPRANGSSVVRNFLAPYMQLVQPFSHAWTHNFMPPGPPLHGTTSHDEFIRQYTEVLNKSAGLDDEKKIVAEYWADGPDSTLPPGHWQDFAVELAEHHDLGVVDTTRLLFLQAQAVFDAGIAAWTIKRYFNNARPITCIQCLYKNAEVIAWRGPYMGSGLINGSTWQPYQDRTFVTPPFAEYISGHSAFSMASARVFKRFFGDNDTFGFSHTVPAGKSLFEPAIAEGEPGYIQGFTDVPNDGPYTKGYVPARPVTLHWPTFTDASREAGISRLWGGIHISAANEDGLDVGRKIGDAVWKTYVEHACPGMRTSKGKKGMPQRCRED